MPEIALTAQFLDRFTARFGVRPAEWHSQLSPRKRARTWAAVAANEVQVVVGARSALFLPYADLGLIIVDEEHDPAYKQEDGAHYHARDMAVVRAPQRRNSGRAGFSDAVGRERGQCAPRALCAAASAGAVRRPASAGDRGDRSAPRRAAARPLHRAAACRSSAEALDKNEQALLFLNRRGFAPLTLCRDLRPPHALPELRCLAGRSSLQAAAGLPPLRLRYAAARRMPEMRGDRKLRCRSAPASSGSSRRRPSCFPRRASSCCRATWSSRWSGCDRSWKTSREHRFDLVIGTQLVAKGHNFPKLNLVGIVDADLGLGNGDPRAAERTFQLAASGGRPRRPHRGFRPRLLADASARASGDARADLRRSRGVLRHRDRGARAHALSAVRAAWPVCS